MPPVRNTRSRRWCFTLNNYTDADITKLRALDFRYLVFGKETAPETGTPHLQGFVIWRNAKTFSSTKEALGQEAHIEPAMGSVESNVTYCSKSGDFEELGQRPAQGSRNDLEAIADMVKDGNMMVDIVPHCKNFQQIRYAEKLKQYCPRVRNWVTTVYWYYGKTGTGKTRQAWADYPDAWPCGKNLKWWEGYDGHKHVIIDDFRADFCTFHELLRILDRYPYWIEVKGCSRQLLAEVIVITCPKHWRDVYHDKEGNRRCDEDLEQLGRRITHTVHFSGSEFFEPQ